MTATAVEEDIHVHITKTAPLTRNHHRRQLDVLAHRRRICSRPQTAVQDDARAHHTIRTTSSVDATMTGIESGKPCEATWNAKVIAGEHPSANWATVEAVEDMAMVDSNEVGRHRSQEDTAEARQAEEEPLAEVTGSNRECESGRRRETLHVTAVTDIASSPSRRRERDNSNVVIWPPSPRERDR